MVDIKTDNCSLMLGDCLERMKEIDEYLRCFGYSIELGYFGKSIYISRNQGKTVCLEELKERLI